MVFVQYLVFDSLFADETPWYQKFFHYPEFSNYTIPTLKKPEIVEIKSVLCVPNESQTKLGFVETVHGEVSVFSCEKLGGLGTAAGSCLSNIGAGDLNATSNVRFSNVDFSNCTSYSDEDIIDSDSGLYLEFSGDIYQVFDILSSISLKKDGFTDSEALSISNFDDLKSIFGIISEVVHVNQTVAWTRLYRDLSKMLKTYTSFTLNELKTVSVKTIQDGSFTSFQNWTSEFYEMAFEKFEYDTNDFETSLGKFQDFSLNSGLQMELKVPNLFLTSQKPRKFVKTLSTQQLEPELTFTLLKLASAHSLINTFSKNSTTVISPVIFYNVDSDIIENSVQVQVTYPRKMFENLTEFSDIKCGNLRILKSFEISIEERDYHQKIKFTANLSLSLSLNRMQILYFF